MANKQTYKDRRRDPSPKNPPPKAQIKEQNVRGRKAVDKPAKPSTTRVRKPRTKAQKQARAVRDGRRRADTVKRDEQVQPKQVANALLRVTDTQEGTIHDEAARLKIRQTGEVSPTETVTVEGNKLEVVARPQVVHPVELLPHLRDTVIKDRLRASPSHEETLVADGVSHTTHRDWREHVAKAERESPQGKAVSGPPSKPKKKAA